VWKKAVLTWLIHCTGIDREVTKMTKTTFVKTVSVTAEVRTGHLQSQVLRLKSLLSANKVKSVKGRQVYLSRTHVTVTTKILFWMNGLRAAWMNEEPGVVLQAAVRSALLWSTVSFTCTAGSCSVCSTVIYCKLHLYCRQLFGLIYCKLHLCCRQLFSLIYCDLL
jgi:hypothetical protein